VSRGKQSALHSRMVSVIARIAQRACRNGEAGTREWESLHELPLRESWRCVGEQYADQALAVLLVGVEDE
jgi:hypothetical protein